jgi:hypothetical protein
MNRFQGTNSSILYSLAGRYDNPNPTQFLTPIDCLKNPALDVSSVYTTEVCVFLSTSIDLSIIIIEPRFLDLSNYLGIQKTID